MTGYMLERADAEERGHVFGAKQARRARGHANANRRHHISICFLHRCRSLSRVSGAEDDE